MMYSDTNVNKLLKTSCLLLLNMWEMQYHCYINIILIICREINKSAIIKVNGSETTCLMAHLRSLDDLFTHSKDRLLSACWNNE